MLLLLIRIAMARSFQRVATTYVYMETRRELFQNYRQSSSLTTPPTILIYCV